MQIHQESMRQQSQFMTTIMLAMIGGSWQFQFPNTPQTLPPFDLNNNDVHRQTGRDEPSFSQVMMVITNQQHQDQRQRQQECEEEREECRARYENQREERRLQMHMHQELMRQQSQIMTTIKLAMIGGNRQFQFPNTPQTLPPFDMNNNDVHGQT